MVYGQSLPEQSTKSNLPWSLLKTSEDYSQLTPIATWNRANGVWVTDQVNLLCGHWVPFLEVWPSSGQMVTMPDGLVCVLPMPVRHITGSESLLSPIQKLPTPKARDAQAEGYEAGLRRATPQVGTVVKALVDGDERLLPTPTTRDYKDGSAEHQRDGVVQTDTVARAVFNSGEIDLLPTPQVDDSKNTGHNQDRRTTLASEVWQTERTTQWGKFEPAIRRWEETLGRPAPAPTKPDGKDGAHRLSSRFTEWMMGLPDGWITDCGLTRNEELKACGNGVVPQQAELALRMLLEGVDFNVR